jgi:hypothetical protein
VKAVVERDEEYDALVARYCALVREYDALSRRYGKLARRYIPLLLGDICVCSAREKEGLKGTTPR